jgi:arsenate reductase
MSHVPTVLFLCVHNAGRSQMAAAWFNQVADPAKARAISAGTQPSDHVHPVVVDAMKEKGIDLSKAEPQKLTSDLAKGAAFLITMGCGESCPYLPGVPVLDWPLPDPKGQGIEPVRLIRDEVESRVRALVKEHGWA